MSKIADINFYTTPSCGASHPYGKDSKKSIHPHRSAVGYFGRCGIYEKM
ncbi:MAG: hypothetical protein KGN01_05595 [Patescibacteria group bacterium]|nr:hypothetical protein [Patescibacteria group bacterium]